MTVCDKDILFKWFYASYECPKPSWKSGLHFSDSQMPRRGWYCLKSQCISYFKLNIYTCEFFFHFRKWEVYLSCLPNAFMMPGEFPCSASIFFTKYPKNSIFAYLCILINYCPVYYEYIGNPIVEIRRSSDRLISIMGFPILVRCHLYIESWPRLFFTCSESPLWQQLNVILVILDVM